MRSFPSDSSAGWELFGHARLGDRRRTARLVSMTDRVLSQPMGTIQAVFDHPAELHGAYDFVENEHVDVDAMREAAAIATARRARGLPFVWIPTDGTSLSVTDLKRTKGTGRVGSGHRAGRGDLAHDALVLDPQGVPLGIAALELWQRGPAMTRARRAALPVEQKETQKWLDVRERVRGTFSEVCPKVVRHYLHDRGADAWPVLLDMVQPRANEHTTVRAAWDRRLWDPTDAATDAPTRYLRQALADAAVLGEMELEVPAGPGRAAREATLSVRACAATLDLKDKRTKKHAPATLWVVCAREVSEVPAGSTPLEWMLLTTYEASTLALAFEVLRGYALRWRIERFHQTWKSAGTDVESSQLHAADHRARWDLILAVVAATLLRWQLLAVQSPTTPAEEEFTEEQLEAVRDMQQDEVVPETGRASLWQVIVALALLGGWAGSKTRPPGATVIARGWTRVMDYLRGKRRAAARAERNRSGEPMETTGR
ncbi:MAG: IS4 family transposase [Polyangiales bacterium]